MQKLKKITLMLIIIIGIIFLKNEVNATSISVTPENPKVGDTITVTVTVPNVHTASVFVNVSGVVSGNIKVVGGDLAGDVGTYSKSATYTCEKEGTINIQTTDNSTAVLNGAYVDAKASKTITVAAKPTENNNSNNNNNSGNTGSTGSTSTEKPAEVISNDATLKNLGIKPNDFSGFKRGTTSYDVTVPNSVSSVSVYAVPNNSNAKVTGTGKKELQEGANKFDVTVTAQDGTTKKTYTINVTRQTAEESNPTEDENTVDENTTIVEEPTIDVVGLTDLQVEGYSLLPVFDNTIYEYNLTVEKDIYELKINPLTSGDNIKVDIVGNSELQEGENIITLLVYNSEKDETTTYQIIVTKTNEIDLTDWNSSIEEANKEMQKREMIIIVTIGFISTASIIFVVYKRKLKNKDDMDESELDKVDEEERIDLNDDKELFKRVNQKEEKINKADEEEVIDVKDDLEERLKEIDDNHIESNYTENNELDDFENMDNLEEFLRKRKEDK